MLLCTTWIWFLKNAYLILFTLLPGWHICSNCQKPARHMCYTCTYSLCKACMKDAKFSCVRENKGFCETCMNTVMLIENREEATDQMVPHSSFLSLVIFRFFLYGMRSQGIILWLFHGDDLDLACMMPIFFPCSHSYRTDSTIKLFRIWMKYLICQN